MVLLNSSISACLKAMAKRCRFPLISSHYSTDRQRYCLEPHIMVPVLICGLLDAFWPNFSLRSLFSMVQNRLNNSSGFSQSEVRQITMKIGTMSVCYRTLRNSITLRKHLYSNFSLLKVPNTLTYSTKCFNLTQISASRPKKLSNTHISLKKNLQCVKIATCQFDEHAVM